MRVEFGENVIELQEGVCRLRFSQGDLGFDLTYAPVLPPWPPFPGRGGYMAKPLVWALAPGRHMHYASMMPRGRVEGSLTLPGGTVDVRGDGYHEQGRTDAPIQRLFTYWYWTRFYLGNWTFIFPVAQSPRRTLNAVMRSLLVYHGNKPVADAFDFSGLLLRHRVLEYQEHPPSGREDIPRRALFTARLPGFRLHAEMDLYHQLEAFRFMPFGVNPPRQPAWLHHVMNVGVEMRAGGRDYTMEGKGVFETMLTGAV